LPLPDELPPALAGGEISKYRLKPKSVKEIPRGFSQRGAAKAGLFCREPPAKAEAIHRAKTRDAIHKTNIERQSRLGLKPRTHTKSHEQKENTKQELFR
jgi:hypothetical protein